MEFAVQISGQKCIDKVVEALKSVGHVDWDLAEGRVVVETESTPWHEIKQKIESTGRRAVLTGFGGQSCVSIIDTSQQRNLKGVIRFCSVSKDGGGCVIDGVVDGLEPGQRHTINVHECGDISEGCVSVGDVYEPSRRLEKIVEVDDEGRASFRLQDDHLAVSDLIGRSVVIGRNQERLGCGIIARSAGIFENYKKICACDGVTLWNERDRPLVGKERRVVEQNGKSNL